MLFHAFSQLVLTGCRVPMVPNNYKDNHFDLKDPDRILGKCFIHFNRNAEDRVGRLVKHPYL